jgi:filamentous hemagglutinin family protein
VNSLNRIYRLVWSVRSASWVAVAETARGCSKRSGRPGAVLDAAVLLAASVSTMLALPALAELPTGATVRAGTLSSAIAGAAMVVTQSTPKAIIDWTSFSIGRGNTVQFIQPDSNAIALNRVTGTARSAIDGGLRANGQVWLLNPNGLLIGAGGQINSAGFLGSTRALSDADFIAGRYQFSDAAKPGGAVVNRGTISAVNGGYVALAGEQVRNEGLVQADFGTVVLAGAKTFVMDVVGDKLLSFAVTGAVDKSPADGMALVDNLGSVRADGGRVLITARSAAQLIDSVVNTAGLVQADSVILANGSLVLGSVTLDGGGSGRVSVDGQVSANAASGKAGAIRISGEAISLNDSARLAATGPGGGGEILIGGPLAGAAPSAKRVGVAAGATIDASAIDSGASADSAAGGGKVSLLASESIAVHGSIKADAAPQSQGSGGEVRVIADLANPNSRTVLSGTISAQAGRAGGNGGFVETSGSVVQIEDLARVDTAAPSGQAGNWLIDPPDLTIQSGAGEPSASFIGAATLANNLANSNITLATSATTNQQTLSDANSQPGNINVNAAVSWSSANKLTLSAYANININADISASNVSNVSNVRLALNYGQGAVATGNSSDYFLKYGVKVNLPEGLNFSTKRGSDGAVIGYTVINGLDALSGATATALRDSTNPTRYFAIGADIDASATANGNAGAGFEPIASFSGVFEGLGHQVSNLSINRPSVNNVGMFSTLPVGSVIQNLGLVGGSTVGYGSVGGLVGRNDGIINNSYNTGNVSAGFRQVGGLVGVNYGVINSSYATGGVTAGTAGVAGGLVGILLSGAVNYSYSTGTVSSSGDLVGGLAGSNDHAEIRNSYATGAVSGRSFVGGLAGTNYLASIINSYAVGSVTGNGNSVGGLVGYTNVTVSSSYWNIATSNQSASAGGVGKTTDDMKKSASYVGWDLTNKWLMMEGQTYPLLRELMVPLLVTANSTSKTYDGQSYTDSYSVSYSRPDVSLTGTLSYSVNPQNSINAGLYMVTPGGLSQANVNQNSYNIIFVSGALKITPAALTVTASAASKTYDGTSTAAITVSTLTGFVPNETVTASATGVFDSANVGSRSATATYTLANGGNGGLASNYQLANSTGLTATINKASLSVAGSTAADKTYDATNVAAITVGTLSGFVPNETVTASATGLFDSANVGSRSATATYTLANGGNGGLASNYQLANSTGLTASIYPAPIIAISGSLTGTVSKVYDGSTVATLAPGNYVLSGFVNDDGATVSKTSGSYDSASAGTGKTVTVTLNSNDYLAVVRTNLSNYSLPTSITGYVGTISMAPLTVSASAATKTYNGSAYNGGNGVGYAGFVNNETIAVLGGALTYGGSSQGAISAGSYVIAPGGLSSSNYTLAYANGTLTVNPAALTITANSASKTYGQTATLSPTAFTASGLQNGETIAGVVETSAGAAATAGVAGSPYAITPSAASGGNFNPANYSISYANGALTVSPAALTVTANNASKTYGQPAMLSPTAFTASGLQNGETISTVTETSAGAAATAGVAGSPYAITPSAASGGNFNPVNYSIAYANGALTVSPAALSISANNASKTYGQVAALSPTAFSASGLQNGETIAGVVETSTGAAATAGVAGSPYAITPSAASGGSFNSANYSIAYANGALTVNPAALTVTANNASKTYGQVAALSPTAFTATGLQNGETIAGVVGTSAGVAATAGVAGSPYAITPSAASGDNFNATNYSIAYVNGALTVSPTDLTVTASNSSKTYGQTAALSPTAFTASGLQNGETIASVLETSAGATATAGVAGSPYPIMPSAASGGNFNPANYSIAYANGALTVSPAALTVTANNANKTYGQVAALSPTAFTASGLQNGETIAGVVETSTGAAATAGVAGSPYAITPSAASGGSFNPVNYSIAYGNGALTVSPAALTISANNANKTYGQVAALSPTEFSASGLQNGETIASVAETSAGASATAGVAGSPYLIMPSAASGGSFNPANYSIAYTGGALTVSPAALTVTANNADKTYGQTATLSPTAFTASGLQNGETISTVTETSAGTATTASVAGSPYAITPSAASGGSFNPVNYSISYGNGALTVSPAALTVTANSASKTYGQTATLSPTAFTTSGLQNSETIGAVIESSAGTGATAGVAGSPYAITPSAASGGNFNAANYSIAYANGALTVSPAALTITANNANKTYGQTATLSPTAFTASGLQNSETIGAVIESSAGTAATAGVAGSPYAITPSAASGGNFSPENYNISYGNGALTVSPAALTISANNANKTYGQTAALSPTAFRASGLQNGETIASVAETSAGAAATAGVAGSPFAITPSAASGGSFNPANYSIAYTGGALTVNPATLTVIASDLSKTYGQTAVLLPTAFDASGLQNNETIGAVVQTSAGTAGTASVAGSPYAITPSAASGGNFNADNYSIAYANGALTVNPGAVTQVLTQLVVVNPVVQNLAPIVPPPAPVAAPVAVPAVQAPVAVADAPAPQAAVAPAAAAPAAVGDQAVAVPAATPAAQATAAAPAAAAGGDTAVPATTPSVQADAEPAVQAAAGDAPAAVASASPATSPSSTVTSAAPPAPTAATPAPAPVMAAAVVPTVAGAAAPATAAAPGRPPAPPTPTPAAAPVVASPAAAATTVVLAAPPSPVAAVKVATPKDAADSGDKTLAAAAPPPPPTAPAQQKRSTAAAPTVSLGMVNIQAPAPAKLPAASNAEQRFSLSGNRSSW